VRQEARAGTMIIMSCLRSIDTDKGHAKYVFRIHHLGDMNPCPEFVSANALESRRQLNLAASAVSQVLISIGLTRIRF
jgi:hypothetical protein